MLSPHPHHMGALVLLVKGAILHLAKVETFGYVFGLLNGVASLACEAKEVLGCGLCGGVLVIGALAWLSFSFSESLQSELCGIFLLGLGDLFCVSVLFTVAGTSSICLAFFNFASCVNSLSDSLATFGQVQDCLGLKLGSKF